MFMISIITPVYNGEQFIESCLQVVIDQQCSDIEHIIVDGGSSDRTVEIIKSYAQNYLHIRWISEKDRGQSDAMNKGIGLAKGKILGFLNVDDYYEPNVLNQILEYFKSLPEPSFLVGNCNVLGNSGELLEVNKPQKMSLYDLVIDSFLNPFPCNPAAYFYHTSLHKLIGFYDIEDHYSMDLDFILRAVRVAKVKYVDETWGNHRRLEGTKTFEDLKNGNSHKRVVKLQKYYRQYLPLSDRFKLLMRESRIKVKYAFKYPQDLPKIIIKKLNN
jgi:glycosyltransferase involved in cell wall biosynthesis